MYKNFEKMAQFWTPLTFVEGTMCSQLYLNNMKTVGGV